MIGIRDISLSSNTFTEHGEYVSARFVTDDVITSITLDADEYIPGDNAEILRYYVSLNGGTHGIKYIQCTELIREFTNIM